MACPRRGGLGEQRLAEYAESRVSRLQAILQAEAERACSEAPGEVDTGLHPQCIKDFDRADYLIGEERFNQGEAAKVGDVDEARVRFADRLRAECAKGASLGDEGAAPRVLHAISMLASQITMAHLGGVCFSGPHTYSLPGGSAQVAYSIQVTEEGAIVMSVSRDAEGFAAFSLPDTDVLECHSSSFCHQSAGFVVRLAGQNLEVEVLEVQESIRLLWPDQRVVVHDGLELNLSSPAPPGGLFDVAKIVPGMLYGFIREGISLCLAPFLFPLKLVAGVIRRPPKKHIE